MIAALGFAVFKLSLGRVQQFLQKPYFIAVKFLEIYKRRLAYPICFSPSASLADLPRILRSPECMLKKWHQSAPAFHNPFSIGCKKLTAAKI